MLIKTIVNGKAIPLSPQEALIHALVMGLSRMNNPNFIHWTHDKNVKVTKFSVQQLSDEGYEAFAEGSVNVGKTKIPEDTFYTAKLYDFVIHYKSTKDPIGAPHLDVVAFSISPANVNPSANVGPIPTPAVKESGMNVLGEILPASGGKVSTRARVPGKN